MKLCLVKVGKSDACTRPLFANSVTYILIATYMHSHNLHMYIKASLYVRIMYNLEEWFYHASNSLL